jgi:hypothetical protein
VVEAFKDNRSTLRKQWQGFLDSEDHATNFFVVARPIPLVPPVTRAIFPESFEVGEFACITDER